MKILYVTPHPNAKYGLFNRFTYPSLTLKQLAAITPPEHFVEIVDERIEKINFQKSEYPEIFHRVSSFVHRIFVRILPLGML